MLRSQFITMGGRKKLVPYDMVKSSTKNDTTLIKIQQKHQKLNFCVRE